MTKESEPPQRTPWASVVRGGDSENASPTANEVDKVVDQEAQSETLIPVLDQDDSGDGRSKRPVWNRPNNGGAEESGGSVMGGAVAWPALSESARTGGSRQVVADGSVSASSLQAPILSPPPQRPANSNNNHSSSTGNSSPSNRQRSRNHRGGGGGGGGGHQTSFNRPSPLITPQPVPPPFPVYDGSYLIGLGPPSVDVPLRSPRPAGGGGGVSQPHMGSDNSSSPQRNNSRRGNYSPRPRGDGSFHNNNVNRREHERTDVHAVLPPQYMHAPPMGFMPPAPQLAPAMAPPFMPPPGSMRVYMGPYDVPQAYYYVSPMPQEPLRPAMPPTTPPHHPQPSVYLGANENSLPTLIVNQINFYFSDDNLVKDGFLRSNMDAHGWVPISLIASFKRIKLLTSDVQVITDSLRNSTFLEVQGDRVRRRNDWSKWCRSSQNQGNSVEDGQSLTSMERLSLEDSPTDAIENHS